MSEAPPYPPPPDRPPEGYDAAPGEPPPIPQVAPQPAPAADPAPVAPLPPAYPTPAAYPSAAPPPAAYAPPAYATPAYGYPPPARQHRAARKLWAIIAAVVVVAVLLVGVLGYVFVGYAYASSRISDAANSINAISTHRSYVNTTLDLIGQQISSFETITNVTLGKSTAGQLGAETQGMTALIAKDDQAMAAARSHLNDQQWLTTFSSGRLAAEAGRIDHARKAAATLKAAAADYKLLAQFFQAYYQALVDWDTMATNAKNKDFVGISTQDALLNADAVKAQQLSTNAPGLPTQYHDFLVILQMYAGDVAKLLNAHTTADSDAADKQAVADVAAMNAIDFKGTAAKIKSYYQHYRNDFNSELDKATA